jgi:hypothetical protein
MKIFCSAFFALLFGMSAGCGGGGPQDQFAAKVEALGGKVERDAAAPGQPVTVVYLSGTPVTDADLAGIGALTGLKKIDFTGTKISDAGLEPLFTLQQLEEIVLENTPVGDPTAKRAAALPKLKRLSLQSTKVTDSGLADLSASTSLEELWLTQNSEFSDAGLEHVAKLPNLTRLDLRATPTTDAGLAHLAKRPTLKYVFLRATKVTPEGVENLRKALPEASIRSDEGSDPRLSEEAAPE